MTEKLLQFIWQFRYFNRTALLTKSGAALRIVRPGQFNTNQGPDFRDALIKIDQTWLAGHIELHIRASDWDKHGHPQDPAYRNIILHVVWEDDGCSLGAAVETLELKQRVPKMLLKQYESWMERPSSIPCSGSSPKADDLLWTSWKDRLVTGRLERKSRIITDKNILNGNNWQETAWQLLARGFGGQVNADAFEALARSLPYRLLARQRHHVTVMEALLLGQSGLLETAPADKYLSLLRREYDFLQKKYGLQPSTVQMQFLRMRPASFPTIRLSQLAVFIQQHPSFFQDFFGRATVSDMCAMLNTSANDYWCYHYTAQTASAYKQKKLGKDMAASIIINSIAPLVFARASSANDEQGKQRVLGWLSSLPAENNKIISMWRSFDLTIKSALETQALLELKTQYCDYKNCLSCSIGARLLSNTFSMSKPG